MDLVGWHLGGQRTSWFFTHKELWSAAQYPSGDQWWVVLLGGQYWGQHCLKCLLVACTVGFSAPSASLTWHQDVLCNLHTRGKGSHPDRPQQVWKVSLCELREVQQGQVYCAAALLVLKILLFSLGLLAFFQGWGFFSKNSMLLNSPVSCHQQNLHELFEKVK